jgi:hypothetical protein
VTIAGIKGSFKYFTRYNNYGVDFANNGYWNVRFGRGLVKTKNYDGIINEHLIGGMLQKAPKTGDKAKDWHAIDISFYQDEKGSLRAKRVIHEQSMEEQAEIANQLLEEATEEHPVATAESLLIDHERNSLIDDAEYENQ